ncbi:MAG: M48 family metallopeptidase [Alphaproteobacteria bacterium]|nr:M48 family metallopeptidase [Alphaproteobacteria bacterium]
MIRLSRSILAGLAAALLVSACETAPVTGRSQMMLISADEERALGLQAFRQVMSTEPVARGGSAAEMVERIGRRIAQAAENPPPGLWQAPRFAWEFRTIEKNVPNAFCLPGGKVAVYTGILPLTQNENGLAVVIGHEVAHALARHGAERVSNQMAAQLGVAAASAAIAATASGRTRTSLPLVMGALGAGATVGVLLPMSRAQESEADRIGLILAAIAGYDPREGVALWQRMKAAGEGRGRNAEWLSTHPAEDTRIQQIREWLPEAMRYYRPRG